MAVRIKDWIIPYTWGIGIEITDNHVINVLLRAMNNLIHVNGDRELYVDLQLDNWIAPEDEFPVWVTTWPIAQEDWWDKNGQILNWKTTSGDQMTLLYCSDDDKLYYAVNLGEWKQIATGDDLEDTNTKTFFLTWTTWQTNLDSATSAYQYWEDGKDPIIMYNNNIYTLMEAVWPYMYFRNPIWEVVKWESYSTLQWEIIRFDIEDDAVVQIWINSNYAIWYVIEPNKSYTTPFTPQDNWDPATKEYVDDWLALKQDKLTAWTNITIDQNNVISATIPQALVYKGTVNDLSDLSNIQNPAIWDTYFVEWEDWMYSWTGSSWDYVWGTGIDTTNLFNKTIDDSDDITEGSLHLFVTPQEKSDWNNKQDKIRAGNNITIDQDGVTINADIAYTAGDYIEIDQNNVINNERPFIPEHDWALGQVLKRTSTWYDWKNEVKWFYPQNDDEGEIGWVLKKTATWYQWSNESWWWWGGWWSSYTAWDGISIVWHVISNTKPSNIKSFSIDMLHYTQQQAKDIADWVDQWEWYSAVIMIPATWDACVFSRKLTGDTTKYEFMGILYSTDWPATPSENGDYTVLYNHLLQLEYDGEDYTFSFNDFNPIANFLKVEDSGYTRAYMPTADYQPATKWYVDAVAAGSVQVPAITNNTTGTTYICSQIWVWTQAQYDLITPVNWVIYNIIPSS